MSVLQEQAVQKIGMMSDMDVAFLLEVIDRLIPDTTIINSDKSRKMQAYYASQELIKECGQYIPDEFDTKKELMEAIDAKYGFSTSLNLSM